MEGGYFTYIAGIASILSFLANVFDWFPKYKNIRSHLIPFFLGALIWSLLGILDTTSVVLDFRVTGFVVLSISLGFLFLTFMFIGFTSNLTHKREAAWAASIAIGLFFFVVVGIGSATLIENESVVIANEKKRLNLSEIELLVEVSENRGDLERALMHLDTLKSRFPSVDPRYDALQSRIDSLKLNQY